MGTLHEAENRADDTAEFVQDRSHDAAELIIERADEAKAALVGKIRRGDEDDEL